MSNNSLRPNDLPDFRDPPLNEVAIGVQFTQPKGYQQIYANEVWNLFRAEYPKVEEHESISPSFETFGLPSIGQQMGLMMGPVHSRFWFMRPDGDELIQFQHDRLLHNWRKIGDERNAYPRFESMIRRFHEEIGHLEGYVSSLSPQTLVINQCEISYVNHIPLVNAASKAADWLRFLEFSDKEPNDFSVAFREVISAEDDKPHARLTCEAHAGIKANRQRIIQLTLTVRGFPKHTDVDSALEFISKGRELIVRKFADVTTSEAHTKWGRIR